MPHFEYPSMLPLQNHPTAIARSFVAAGETLERAPGLVVPKEQMETSPFSPMIFYWHDLNDDHKEQIKELRDIGAFRMKTIRNETGRMDWDVLEYFDDAAILPAGGNIALIQKVGPAGDPNCRMEILSNTDNESEESAMDYGSSGLILKIVAIRDIPSGEELRLKLPDNSSWDAKMSLQQHLALLGQPIPRHIVETYNPLVMPQEEEEAQEQEI